jgi:hypothetical protein|tara:strand:- start:277 stop:642 length:366 start_codon:yes stop_codon:yes gene_type:complete
MKKIYILFGLLSFVLGQPLLFYNEKLGLTILLGTLVPIVMSYINLEVIEYISNTKGNQLTLGFNMIQFITKSIFMVGMTYLGVAVLELDFRIYIPILSFTWFTFHVLEAFFTQKIIEGSWK